MTSQTAAKATLIAMCFLILSESFANTTPLGPKVTKESPASFIDPAVLKAAYRESVHLMSTKKMLRGWEAEDIELGVYRIQDPQELEALHVYIHNGYLYYSNGHLVPDTPERLITDELKGVAYVLDAKGNLYIENPSYTERGVEFRHSSFFSGAPLAGAGDLIVKNGVITRIDDTSGHYRPDRAMTLRVLERLHLLGVRYDPDEVYSAYDPQP